MHEEQDDKIRNSLIRALYFSTPKAEDEHKDSCNHRRQSLPHMVFRRASEKGEVIFTSEYVESITGGIYFFNTSDAPVIRVIELLAGNNKIDIQDNKKGYYAVGEFERIISVTDGQHNYELRMQGKTALQIDLEDALATHFAGCVESLLKNSIRGKKDRVADLSGALIRAANKEIFNKNQSFKSWLKLLCFLEPEVKEGIAKHLNK